MAGLRWYYLCYSVVPLLPLNSKLAEMKTHPHLSHNKTHLKKKISYEDQCLTLLSHVNRTCPCTGQIGLDVVHLLALALCRLFPVAKRWKTSSVSAYLGASSAHCHHRAPCWRPQATVPRSNSPSWRLLTAPYCSRSPSLSTETYKINAVCYPTDTLGRSCVKCKKTQSRLHLSVGWRLDHL